ncbi:hypothetical protein [Prevotella sp. kh1p2]|uniref:hypothetical protein n=1 Tax=Prevotella sp. kh1p2 TaxID=1761883 RepID=UPI0008BC36B4|nr:hypothetical protein [Prevotella sp. kh1p2]SES98837.1 hypothetical protein SAMN04487825_11027 [Prevotella sp. kh1p2]SNU11496.1 hypothetical protein SAMN06298210_11126 [Prevotellaceae bacterium KH2P17]
MKRIQTILTLEFWLPVALSLIIVVLYETEWLADGVWATDKSLEFVIATVMELLTICLIPLALRLFKFKHIHRQLHQAPEDVRWSSLLRYGSLRLNMLCLPLLVNTLLYYLFMNVAFGYMAIILLLCLFFVYPSMARCVDDTLAEN